MRALIDVVLWLAGMAGFFTICFFLIIKDGNSNADKNI